MESRNSLCLGPTVGLGTAPEQRPGVMSHSVPYIPAFLCTLLFWWALVGLIQWTFNWAHAWPSSTLSLGRLARSPLGSL